MFRTTHSPLRRRVLGAVSALALALVGAGVVAPAQAADPVAAATSTDRPTVSSDALPTVQMNGVVWAQTVVGNTVYAAGSFTSARPAGSPAGVNETPRSHLLAFDIRTGELLPWAPALNAQARAIAASPDGRTIYVGGDFTAANGTTRGRFAAFDAATGALDPTIKPLFNATVQTIVASATTVYAGGNFETVTIPGSAGVRKPRVAAVSASTGALTSFFASVQPAQVDALALTPDGSKLVLGGRFQFITNVPARGVGWVNATSGAVVAFPANQVVQNYGYSAGITSLSIAGDLIVGSGFHRLDRNDGSVGNLEGMFAADAGTGQLVWVADCKGDNYSAFPSSDGHLYTAGHAHDCSAAGGFPEVSPRVHMYGLAFTRDARLTTAKGAGTAHAGQPSPALANWFPAFASGTYTGQLQAGWSVVGNDDYVVYGGEFPRVNGVAQNGLVRFAKRTLAPNSRGPALTGANTTPSAVSRAAGTVQVSWPVNHDPDDGTLTYRVLRNGNAANPVATVVHSSRYWDRGRLSATDTGLAAGTYSYTVVATDSAGRSVTSPAVQVTTAATGTLSTYASTVLADAPANYWRLGDSGSTMNTWTGFNPGTSTGVTTGVTGAIAGDTDRAMRFAGTSTSTAASSVAEAATNELSVEAWFSTTTTRGGKIVGFGSSRTGDSAIYDRHLTMSDDGRLSFGVNPREPRVVTSTRSYNDGAPHHVVGTLGASGLKLYVDGELVASDLAVSTGQYPVTGYWRIGGDTVTGWPLAPTSGYFAGTVDEVATYSRALTAEAVVRHHSFGTTGGAPRTAPVASFEAAPDRLTVAVDATASSDADGTIATYAWTFGDGSTATGRTASHAYARAGTYTVRLTVTDDHGLTGTTTREVTVGTGVPTAAFDVTTTGLTASVDAGGSTDPDGTIAAYAWTFGDGTTATGRTAAHAYGEAGTYTVRLTVTDDDGQTATASRSVTVSPAARVLGRDAFERTVTSGFGSAEVGGAWTTTAGASTVSGGAGVLTLAKASSAAGARLPGAAGPTTVTQVSTSFDKLPNGGGAFQLLRGRIAANGDEYRLKVQYTSAGKVTAWLASSVAGRETAVVPAVTVPVTYRAGDVLVSRFAVTGSSPTRLQAKVWAQGTAEPADWTLSTTDATPSLQVAGHVGLYGQLSSSTTNGPVALRFDDLVVADGTSAPAEETRVAPTATFTSTATGLSVQFDAAGSADGDGTIAEYAWTFGDGATATGVNPTHAYGAAGTYPVVLTVTDDDGLTATSTRDVTVTAPAPAEQAPTASFTTAVTGLSVTLDASASADPDGTITGYAWDLGDGATATGSTASHTYAAAGTYTVTLTVTDSAGLTGTTTRTVTVEAPATDPADGTVARDAFARTVTAGWGSADLGGPWTASAGGTSVAGGAALFTLAKAGSAAAARLPGATGGDLVTQVKVVLDKVPNGSGAYGLVRARIAPNDDAYRMKLQYTSAGQVKVWWTKTVNGAETTISTFNTAPGVTYAPGTVLVLKASATGTNPTRLQSKVWVDGTAEPTTWIHDVTDTTASLQTAGHVGLWGQLSGSATNGPLVMRFDDFLVTGSAGGGTTTPQAPTASFTTQAADLSLTVDGSGSSDPDGTIASYAWAFGDGASGTGATASHTYAAAGTYTVTLTVTDSSGLTATTTRTVTVSEPAPQPEPDPEPAPTTVAQDAFQRAVTSGWGTADTGGDWVATSTRSSVADGTGVFTLPGANAAAAARLPGASGTDLVTQVAVSLDKVPNGSGSYALIRARIAPNDDAYRMKLQYTPAGQVKVWWTKSVAGVETTISTFNTAPGVTYGPGTVIVLKAAATGTSPTRLRSKVWVQGQPEPTAWIHDFTDSTASLQGAGHVGLWQQLSSSTTNGPLRVRFDDLLVTRETAA